MKCPVCANVDLLLAERQGVEIDHCPNCRGVWPDRGELNKILPEESALSGKRALRHCWTTQDLMFEYKLTKATS